MKNIAIILDAAHGVNVSGKCSPDKSHYEWKWSRTVCDMLEILLIEKGYKTYRTSLGDLEPGLSKRVKAAEDVKEPKKLLISIHNNAAGDGTQWKNAHGVEIWTTPGNTKSDIAATEIMNNIARNFPKIAVRSDYADGDIDKEANFTVLTGKGYSAVLLEWLFQDSKEDLAIIKDLASINKLCYSLVQSIEVLNTKL
jgi:N-acetylmuramoyl-L-alanine amidase